MVGCRRKVVEKEGRGRGRCWLKSEVNGECRCAVCIGAGVRGIKVRPPKIGFYRSEIRLVESVSLRPIGRATVFKLAIDNLYGLLIKILEKDTYYDE
jgi:hypothetical protein